MFFAARTFAMKFGQSLAMILFTSLAVAMPDAASTADEVRTNTEITAQQINRPIETRGTSNSMLNNRMNSNYGG
jgi:hypothetical protein